MGPKTLIKIKNLTVVFKNKKVLHNISFSCSGGEIIGLIGNNGAGKTTIMKSIVGLIKSSGEMYLDHIKLGFGNYQGLEYIGSLIESPGMYPYLSGRQNLELLAKPENKNYIDTLIEKLDLASFIDKKTKKYSLGMKQKLGIAIAFVNRPKLVILDEPLNGLDPKSVKKTRQFLLDQKKLGTTLLISSHILNELQKTVDKVILIDEGFLIKDGPIKDFVTQKNHITLATNSDVFAKDILLLEHFNIENVSPLTISFSPGKLPLQDITDILNKHGIKILDIQVNTHPNLEDTILNLLN